MAAPCPGAAPAACSGRTPHSVGVIFEVRRAESRPGETLRVTGAGRELGDWGAEDTCGLQLRTSVSVYPAWTMLYPLWIEAPEGEEELWLEYKYIRDLGLWGQAGHRVAWEDGIENRRAKIPCKRPGVWVVSDAVWGSEGLPEIRPTLESEIGRLRDMLDPDPLALTVTVPRLPLAPMKAPRERVDVAPPRRPLAYDMTPESESPRRQSKEYAIEWEYRQLPLSARSSPSMTRQSTMDSMTDATPRLILSARACGDGRAGSPGGLAKLGAPGAAWRPALPQLPSLADFAMKDWGTPGPWPARSASSASDPEVSGREQPASPEVAGGDWEIDELWVGAPGGASRGGSWSRGLEELRRQNEELLRENEELRRCVAATPRGEVELQRIRALVACGGPAETA